MFLLCGYLALFPAISVWLLARFFSFSLWPLAAPFVWLVTEWIRAHLLTGFPWLSIGYSQMDTALVGLLPIVGEIGLSALMISFCAAVAVALSQKRVAAPLIYGSILICASWIAQQHNWITTKEDTVSIALVQGNIEQSIRWRPEQDIPTIEKYKRLTEPFWQHDIIVWPEAAIPVLESLPLGTETLESLDLKATQMGTALITGSVDYNYLNKEAYNNLLALGIDKNGVNSMPYKYLHENRFAKHHLLPIGEFVPFEGIMRTLAPIFDLPMSSFNRGDFIQNNLVANGYNLVPAICYEIAFPQQVKANINEESDIIITVSNDAWFGNSHGPHQHLEIARMRAIEFGLPVIRATNTGVTAAFDHKGNNIGQLPQFHDDVLSISMYLTKGHTPYKKFGDLPSYLFSLIAFGLALLLKRKFALKIGV